MNHEIPNALNAFNFRELFIEILGWDKPANPQAKVVVADDAQYTLQPVANKWGFLVFSCETDELPDSQTLAKIAHQAGNITPENLIIFHDVNKSAQVWQWAKREPGKAVALRHNRMTGKASPLLVGKIETLSVSLDEEEKARNEGRDTLLSISTQVRAAFDVEKVTKKFYERFSKEHQSFLAFIKGIPDDDMQSWYASVMLNRLMFIYFIQHKGFLYIDGKKETGYLRYQLQRAKKEKRPFYKDFLRPLFERAFATPQQNRSAEDDALFGRVPYLNGGLFTTHRIERENDNIQIADAAFEKIFAFFDDYDWHLDDNPLREGREINPDVLGYIFEKYINQKQMGAYYTKEDITGYIARNTILPFWLQRAKEQIPKAFSGENSVWKLLQENPDKYIYPAVRFGLRDADKKQRALPENIARGVDDVSQRGDWNSTAPHDWALPTEIWREVVARRQKYFCTYEKLASGQISSVDDLITENLDIVQFCQDVVTLWADESLLRELWKALAGTQNRTRKSNQDSASGLSVLDPTCGSGAFLFAAINILEPLYSACLDRMTGFVNDAQTKKLTQKNVDFRDILAHVDDQEHHPNREYFVLKNILVNNLFGVDIMEEAVEICKLRLFLKLASTVEPDQQKENFGIEPLPDIDFNIRAGNTLVGFATAEEVQDAVAPKTDQTGIFDFDDTFADIQKQAEDIDSAFNLFRDCQTENRDSELPAAKTALRAKLETLRDQLDAALAEEYETGLTKNAKAYADWRDSHKPFHWFIEFYGILKRGGFDCIIGNPPYVEYSKVKKEYEIKGFETESCGNLYAFAMERGLRLLKKDGQIGFIIPVASVCTDGYAPLLQCLRKAGRLVVSNFNDRPAKLFDGLEHIRLSIILCCKNRQDTIYSTRYNKWAATSRTSLFANLNFIEVSQWATNGYIPKVSSLIELNVWQKLNMDAKGLSYFEFASGKFSIFYTRKLSGFVQILDFVPKILDNKNKLREPSELKEINLVSDEHTAVFTSALNSSLFYWLLTVQSDCRNLNKREIYALKFDVDRASGDEIEKLRCLAKELSNDLKKNSKMLKMKYQNLGELTIQCTYPKLSKPIIDEIDRVLASHYGFTDEELDFIINYDIKYRMGRGEKNDD